MDTVSNDDLLTIIADKTKEFGRFSNAVLVTKLFLLQNLIKFDDSNPLVTELRDEIKTHYQRSLPEHLQVRKAYNKELYHCLYHQEQTNVDKRVSSKIVHVQNYKALDSLEDNKWYIYIIDEFDNFKVFDYPITTAELIMKRAFMDGTQITHPLLLSEPNNRVKVAGELSTIRFDDRLKGILINNRSGHFQPHNDSLTLVTERLENLGINPQNIYVTSMG